MYMIIEKRSVYIQAMLVVPFCAAEENHCLKLLYINGIGDGSKSYFWKEFLSQANKEKHVLDMSI